MIRDVQKLKGRSSLYLNEECLDLEKLIDDLNEEYANLVDDYMAEVYRVHNRGK